MAESKTVSGVSELFDRLGFTSRSLLKVRFGGIVGKIALVAVFVAIGLIVVADRTQDPSVQRLCVYALLAVLIIAVGAIFIHGLKHPLEATLEGGQIMAYQQLQHDIAAKGMKQIPSSPVMLEGLGSKPMDATDSSTGEKL